jgi:hypothetical protein
MAYCASLSTLQSDKGSNTWIEFISRVITNDMGGIVQVVSAGSGLASWHGTDASSAAMIVVNVSADVAVLNAVTGSGSGIPPNMGITVNV